MDSHGGLIVRTHPAVFDHNIRDFLIVVGGQRVTAASWLPRVRAAQKKRRLVALLSDAATAYIKEFRNSEQNVTTHWRDAHVLEEWGDYPNLTLCYAENSAGTITSAGATYTSELILEMISNFLTPHEFSEIGSRLVLQSVRNTRSFQPKGSSYLVNAFGPHVSNAIKLMEENLAEPVSTRWISAEVGVSIRQLERLFSQKSGLSPGRYYKKVRLGKAHILVTETDLSLIDIAVATGFGSVASLTTSYKVEYGATPHKTRYSRKFAKSPGTVKVVSKNLDLD